MRSRQELVTDVLVGVLSSFLAAASAYYAARVHRSGDAALVAAIAVAFVSMVAALHYRRRARARALPGLRAWLSDRAADDYAYRLLKSADHSP